jgi:hypothetical protein
MFILSKILSPECNLQKNKCIVPSESSIQLDNSSMFGSKGLNINPCLMLASMFGSLNFSPMELFGLRG